MSITNNYNDRYDITVFNGHRQVTMNPVESISAGNTGMLILSADAGINATNVLSCGQLRPFVDPLQADYRVEAPIVYGGELDDSLVPLRVGRYIKYTDDMEVLRNLIIEPGHRFRLVIADEILDDILADNDDNTARSILDAGTSQNAYIGFILLTNRNHDDGILIDLANHYHAVIV